MIRIRVPATSANIGPGFDCLGVALSIYNEFYFEKTDSGLVIEGCQDEFKNENNLVYTSFNKTLCMLNHPTKGIRIVFKTNIPVSRGLGSSASCIVAGVAAAGAFAGINLSKEEVLNIAAGMEGHPDNVTPAVMGGMTVSVMEKGRVYYSGVNLPQNLEFCALVPDFRLSTELSRSQLPEFVPLRDGAYNAGRASLLVAALNSGKTELIPVAVKDMLHENYRKGLIEDYDHVVGSCISSGALTAFLSGAGPTIMCIIKKEDKSFMEKIYCHLKQLRHKWTAIGLKPDFTGYSFI